MAILVTQIRWLYDGLAIEVVQKLRKEIAAEAYARAVDGLRDYICGYINSDADCREKQGDGISPVRCPIDGAKALKVRWGIQGRGKRGSLRLAVLLHCDKHRVKIVGCWFRNEDPSDDEIDEALRSSP